jgi:hypothetical protein
VLNDFRDSAVALFVFGDLMAHNDSGGTR